MNIKSEVNKLNKKLAQLFTDLENAQQKKFFLKAKNINYKIRHLKNRLAKKKRQLREQEEEERPKLEPKYIRDDGKIKDNSLKEEGSPTPSEENNSLFSGDELLVDSDMAKIFDPDFDEFLFTFDKEEVGNLIVILLKELSKTQTELNSLNSVTEYKPTGIITRTRKNSLQEKISTIEDLINKLNI